MRPPYTTLALALLGAAAASASSASPPPNSLFAHNVIHVAPPGQTLVYPRVAELLDGRLLATASWLTTPAPGQELPFFPIFASDDGAASWTWIANLTDQANAQGMTAQPALAVLPFAVGAWPAGTVLASGNSWGPNATVIDLYASTDRGVTWQFVSNVARGGAPETQDGVSAIWEPFIVPFNNTVGVFYSDQRDPRHAQKLAHQESSDLRTWGPVVDDVAPPHYAARPGNNAIAYVPPLARWLLVYEFFGGADAPVSRARPAKYPVHYRLAVSPFAFGGSASSAAAADDGGVPLVTAAGRQANASPYVVWSAAGGGDDGDGTIVVSDAGASAVFVNGARGAPDQWVEVPTPQPAAYSRALLVFRNDPDRLLILGAATYGQIGQPVSTNLSCSVVSVSALMGMGKLEEMGI